MLFGPFRDVLAGIANGAIDKAERRIAIRCKQAESFTSDEVKALLEEAKRDLQDVVRQVRNNLDCVERDVLEVIAKAASPR